MDKVKDLNYASDVLTVTVGIPCYNEQSNIALILNDVCSQDLPEWLKVEKIIVDASGSTDLTVDIAKTYANKDKRVIVFHEEPRRGKASSINRIMSLSSSKILAIISGDLRITDNSFLRKLVRRLAKEDVGMVVAKVVPTNDPDSIVGFMGHLLWRIHNKLHIIQQEMGLVSHAGEAFAFKKEYVSFIPEDVINDDAYIALHLQLKGFKVSYEKGSIAYNRAPSNIVELILQRTRVLAGHNQLMKRVGKKPDTIHNLFLKRPLLALNILVSEISSLTKGNMIKLLATLMFLFTELISYILSFVQKHSNIWKPIRSTKII